MGSNTLPTIWGTYMKLVTKYQISAITSCWEKCDEKCAYMFIVYKNQLSRQTGSRNLTGPKSLPTIWNTYMTLVTKYQISAINSYWEKCDEIYLGRTEGQTDRGKTVYPLPLNNNLCTQHSIFKGALDWCIGNIYPLHTVCWYNIEYQVESVVWTSISSKYVV
jgi:hypothetical protein